MLGIMVSEFNKRLLICLVLIIVGISSVAYSVSLLLFELTTLPEVIVGIVFVLLLVLNFFFTLIGSYYYILSSGLKQIKPGAPLKGFPAVAVLIPIRNEDEKIVYESAKSMQLLKYPKEKLRVFLVDNNDSPDAFIESTAKEFGFEYRYVQNPAKFKSFALNAVLPELTEEYFAIFDADEKLFDGNFLVETLPFLEENQKVAFVQTCKKYSEKSLFSNAINSYYLYFYNHIQPLRDLTRTPMCCGSCAIFRASIVKGLGGFRHTPTEDADFSFRADLAGFDGRYFHKLFAVGEPIDSLSSFMNQQFRYAYGISKNTREFVLNFFRLSRTKRLHYLSQIFGYHFLSYPPLLFALITMFFVLVNSDVFTFNFLPMLPVLYGTAFTQISAIGYFVVFMALIVFISKIHYGSYKIGLTIMFLNFATLIPRIKAIVLGTFEVGLTHAHTREIRPPTSLISVLLSSKYELLVFFAIAAVAVIAFSQGLVVALFWLAWYLVIFSSRVVFLYLVDLKKLNQAKTGIQ